MKTNALRNLVVTACLLFTGCAAVGPDFEKPEVEVANEWLESADAEVDASRSEYQDWWQVFNDPVLNELIATAYGENLNLQVAGLRILEARAQLGYSEGLRYPQSQSVQASASRSRLSENAPPFSALPPSVGTNINNSISFWSTSFNVAWEADVWGRFRRGIEAADANLAATMLNYDAVLVTLTGDVALVYTTIRTHEQQLLYTRNNVQVQKRALDLAEARFELGATSELDVTQAKSQLNGTQAIIPFLELNIRRARNALSLLLGMEPGEVDSILGGLGTLPGAPQQAAVGIPAELIRRRPDVRAAEMAAAAQSAAIGVATADLYPSFALVGSFGIAGESFSDQFESGSSDGFISPVINWKIFNYGRLRNNIRVQDARFEQLVIRYENVILNAMREVEDGLIGFLRAQDEVGYLIKAVAASERSVELSLDQYQAGIADYQRVLQSQSSLLLQQDALAKARGRVISSLVSTYRSLGGGWQLREGQTYVNEDTLEKMRERTNWGKVLDDQTDPAHLDPGKY
jgi:NodT family efflux transporter outer membrane factor (OMF) lipoprotein